MKAYPTDIVTDQGWCRIHQGHALDLNALLADLEESHGGERLMTWEECWLSYQPRVKWCGNHGDACDQEGEWHAHWQACRAGYGDPFTIVIPSVVVPTGEENDQ